MSTLRTFTPLMTLAVATALLTGCAPGAGPAPSATPGSGSGSSSASPAPDASPSGEPAPPVDPLAEARADIEAAMTSGNTAALEGRMSNPIRVVIAATEYGVDTDPAQAVADLSYVIDSGTDFDFSLPAGELATWRTHFYADYIPDGAVIGRNGASAVVSFTLDADGTITRVFMAAGDELMLH